MASIEPIKPADDDRQVLRLDAEASKILVESLLIEWETQAKCVAEETSDVFAKPHLQGVRVSDAAWKVRRQAVIVDMLEQLDVVK